MFDALTNFRSTEPQMEFSVGQTIEGRWRVLDVMRGGMAVVYKVYDTNGTAASFFFDLRSVKARGDRDGDCLRMLPLRRKPGYWLNVLSH